MLEYLLPLVLGAAVFVVAWTGQYSVVEIIIFAIFLGVVFLAGFHYFFGTNLTANLGNLFTKKQMDITVADISGSNSGSGSGSGSSSGGSSSGGSSSGGFGADKGQVFHVPGQYDYQNAKALCKAYGAKIANYPQLDNAYQDGAEWCEYGWSDDQMSLYPTQYKTWLQFKNAGDGSSCGRPGVNGGYNQNPKQLMGVNCFGKKPKQNGELPPPPMPQTAVDAKVNYWQSQIPGLKVSPFNYKEWSE